MSPVAEEHPSDSRRARDGRRPGGSAFTAVIIDDHTMLADALRSALNGSDDIRVVAVAGTIEAGVEATRRHQPDVIVVDYRLPDGDSVRELERFKSACADSRCIIITGWPDENGFVHAMLNGAVGFLDKRQSLADLVHGIRRVVRGEIVVAPRFLPIMARRMRHDGSDFERVTPRELEILALLARGATTSEVAEQLTISVNTVRNHIHSVLRRLGAHSRLEAVHIAIGQGLIRLDPAGS